MAMKPPTKIAQSVTNYLIFSSCSAILLIPMKVYYQKYILPNLMSTPSAQFSSAPVFTIIIEDIIYYLPFLMLILIYLMLHSNNKHIYLILIIGIALFVLFSLPKTPSI